LANDGIKDVVRKFCDALSKGDAKAAADVWAADSINHGTSVPHEAVEKLMQDIARIHERYEIKEMIAERDWVACRIIVSGKHKARPTIPFDGGIYMITEPDGRPFTTQHIHMFRIVDGKIKEHWANRDDLGAARQLGLDLKPV
jgi:predicted ester cyclase